MNVGKSMVKVDLAKTLGSQYSEMVRAAEKDQLRQEGARDALKLAARRVGDLGLHVDKDLEEGKLSASDMKDPKKVEEFIKRFIKRAVGVLDNLATTAEVARTVANGRAKGLQAAEEVVKNMGEGEVKKLAELQRQIESGEVSIEEATNREAPPSLKHQREDEEAAEVVEAEATSEPASKGTKPPVKKSAAKAPKKRPKRKPTPKKGSSKKG